MRLAAHLLPLALLAASASAHPGVAILADEIHLGDGRVLTDGVVVVHGDRIEAVGPARSTSIPADAERHRVRTLVPGLVAGLAPASGPDALSVEPGRLAIDLVDRLDQRRPWLESGVTALAISPGAERLVPGRSGVMRLTEALDTRAHLSEGPLHAVLTPGALNPPAVLEPQTPVNVDNPLESAQPQRPESPSAAVAELRALLAGREGVFGEVARGRTRLAVHADNEDEIGRALDLVEGTRARLVIVGGTESWKLADRLAGAGASVWLTGAATGLGPGAGDGDDWRPDVAARLAAAGVPFAFAVDAADGRPAPLMAAAASVRAGLPEAAAIAAVTGRAAALAGSPELGVIRRGGVADLAGFDGPALALHARPVLVFVDGVLRHEVTAGEDEDLLVLRAGRLTTAERSVRDASLVMDGGRVRGIETGTAVPAGAEVRDFGPDAVIVPGLLDAFAWIGLEEGPPVGGSVTLRGADAVETDHPSLGRALASGVTSTLAAPWTSGPFRGRADWVSTSLLPADEAEGRRRDSLERLGGNPPFVFWLDNGPADTGARSGRTAALSGLLRKAKGYHDQWTAFEKKQAEKKKPGAEGKKKKSDGKGSARLVDPRNRPGRGDGSSAPKGGGGKAGKGQESKAPEKSPELEPWRDLFRGKTKAIVRAGRHDSIRDALKAFGGVGVTPVLVGAEEADLVAGEIAKAKVPVILRPNLTRLHEGELRLVAAELRAAGVTVAFGSQGLGNSDRLPLLAADAVRLGLSPSDALRALTLGAATVAGAPAGLGRLAVGDRADCVVYSGDPMEPASRVLAVVVRGRIVHEWGDDLSGLGQ